MELTEKEYEIEEQFAVEEIVLEDITVAEEFEDEFTEENCECRDVYLAHKFVDGNHIHTELEGQVGKACKA